MRTVIESIMLGHPPETVQMVLADCKGWRRCQIFEGCRHVSHVITDLENDQSLIDRFIEALWGEIARRKEIATPRALMMPTSTNSFQASTRTILYSSAHRF